MIDTIDAMLSSWTKLTEQLNEVIHRARISKSWNLRGGGWPIRSTIRETDASLRVKVMNASKSCNR